MSIEFEQQPLAPRLQSLLAGLRLRIRGYVWTEGLAAAVVVLGAAFWVSLAFDWLVEPPWQFRAVVLVLVAASVSYILYRLIGRRAFRSLDDTSMAVLLERRYREYRDSLLTTVELGRRADHAAAFNREMLSNTREQALANSSNVKLGEVFRFAPLLRTLGFAAALAVSVLAFAVFAPQAFGIWVQRVVLLDADVLWPRKNHVRVQGFPENKVVKVAKGSDLELTAVADLRGEFEPPSLVQVRYRTAEGVRGRDNMTSVGTAGPRDDEQKFTYTFKGVLNSLEFDVYGGDDRDRGYKIEAVDNPAISKMELVCKYPEYTGRVPGTLPASGLMQLPAGTQVTIRCEANKDLVEVPVTVIRGEQSSTLLEVKLPTEGERRKFDVPLEPLMEDTTLLFELHDADGIKTNEKTAVRLILTVRPDEAPIVATRLRGISTAVTANARLPVIGELKDDYGLSRLWFEYQLEQQPPGEQPFRTRTLGGDGRPRSTVNIELPDEESIDLKRHAELAELLTRRGIATLEDLAKLEVAEEKLQTAGLKTQDDIDRALAMKPAVGQRLFLTMKAADNCALPTGENIGQGERYQLDVVSAEQLMSMLEGRELMLRRRFEVIYQEMLDTRDALARVDFTPPDAKQPQPGDKAGQEPGDNKAAEPGAEPGDAKETPEQKEKRLATRAKELRELRVNRALDNSDRAGHETLTVADSFDEIREEMVNNRVDTPELQTRLKDQIADPLRSISTKRFPVLRTKLTELRLALDDANSGQPKLDATLAEFDAILIEMKGILDRMLELETFNEVVEILRQIIAQQGKISEATLQKQKDELKNKLRDLQE